jgi:hypothetical protein
MAQPSGASQQPATPAGRLGLHALKAFGAGITVPIQLIHTYENERKKKGAVERAARTGCAWVILGPFVALFAVASVFAIVTFVIWTYAAAVALLALIALIVQAVTKWYRQRQGHVTAPDSGT